MYSNPFCLSGPHSADILVYLVNLECPFGSNSCTSSLLPTTAVHYSTWLGEGGRMMNTVASLSIKASQSLPSASYHGEMYYTDPTPPTSPVFLQLGRKNPINLYIIRIDYFMLLPCSYFTFFNISRVFTRFFPNGLHYRRRMIERKPTLMGSFVLRRFWHARWIDSGHPGVKAEGKGRGVAMQFQRRGPDME